jgi:hypothetical protein
MKSFFKQLFKENKKAVTSVIGGLLICAGVPAYLAVPSSEVITDTVETELVAK